MKTAVFLLSAASLALSQVPDGPAKFLAADIAISPRTSFPNVRQMPPRDSRYELKLATMVDLISRAYGFDADKVLGGPSWLEMDRFDITAKLPPDSTPDSLKLMLQALLQERFQLKVHPESKPLPAYALVVAKKLQMKPAEGSEQTGCKVENSSDAGSMTIRIGAAVAGPGNPTQITLGPGGTIHYACRNMTMAGLAAALRGLMGASLGPIMEETGLEGHWNFELAYTMLHRDGDDKVTIFDTVEKLGLKLESKPLPTPVMVVDGVNRKPSPNPVGTAEILPPIPIPTEFEVASVKPSDSTQGTRTQSRAGGRVVFEGVSLLGLVGRAFSVSNDEQLVGLPKWAETERFDIDAKAAGGTAGPMDLPDIAPMLRALLVDRFKMTYHSEERSIDAYSLLAGKPRMKKADPASRTFCKNISPPPGSPAGSQALTCQNITMAQFADRLLRMSPELTMPVNDATAIEGGWDFTLTFGRPMMAPGGGAAPAVAGAAAASDPTGNLTFFEAVEKQLGLKLEMQKRPMPVTVIDHIEPKPTEN